MRIYRRGESKIWHFEFRHKGQHYRRSSGTDRKQDAERIAEEFRAARRRGEPEESPGEPGREALSASLADFVRELSERGCTARYIREVASVITRLCTHAGVAWLDQLDTQAIERGRGAFAGRSARTRNKAVTYTGSFTAWLERTGRTSSDPARAVRKVRKAAVLSRRRALTVDEIATLTDHPDIPPARRLLYLVAIYTGLRIAELMSLERDDLHLDEHHLRLRARSSKNRKEAIVELAPIVCQRWREWLKNPVYRVGNGIRKAKKALCPRPEEETFYEDFARANLISRGEPTQRHPAGKPIHDDGTTRLDFHSLRVTFVTSLWRGGISLQMAQRLARHSSPDLTANIYTALDRADQREAIELLSDLLQRAQKRAQETQKSEESGAESD